MIRSVVRSVLRGAIKTAIGVIGSINPLGIAGALLVAFGKIMPRGSWNVAGFQLNNEADETKNLKCITGGYFIADRADQNYVDGNKFLGFGSRFEGGGWFNTTSTDTQVIIDSRDSGRNGFLIGTNVGFGTSLNTLAVIVLSGVTSRVETAGTYTDGEDYYYEYSYDGTNTTLSVYDSNGVFIESATNTTGSVSVSTNFKISSRSFSTPVNYWTGNIKDVWHRSSFDADDYKADEIRNNPQLLGDKSYIDADGNFDLAVTFREGNAFNADAIENTADLDNPMSLVSGNTVSCIGNDAPVGFQNCLSSYNEKDHGSYISFLHDVGNGIDSEGNAIQTFWKQGTLNLTAADKLDNPNGGIVCGDQINVWDVENGRVIAFAFYFIDTGNAQYIATNRVANDGFRLYSSASNQLIYENEVSGTSAFVVAPEILVTGNRYRGVLTHFGTTASIYLTEINESFPLTPTATNTVGAIGVGSSDCLFGIRPVSLTFPFSGLISIPQLYDKSSITDSEIKTLAEYNKD